MNEVRILQIGKENFGRKYEKPRNIRYFYFEKPEEAPPQPFDLVILDRAFEGEELEHLYTLTRPYCLYVMEQVVPEGDFAQFFNRKRGQILKQSEIAEFLWNEAGYYFPVAYGVQSSLNQLSVSRNFAGNITWNGNVKVCLSGEFGTEYRQAAFFRDYISIEEMQTLDFWLEYQKDPGVSLLLEIKKITAGTTDEIEESRIFKEEQLKDEIRIENHSRRGLLFVSIRAKGCGTLVLSTLHCRISRGGHGHFLPGGERYVTSKREELFCYFDPGDARPPLNVRFSGYQQREEFALSKNETLAGEPLLLLYDPRMNGGNGFTGTEEYERLVLQVIQSKMEELGFSSEEVLFSGFSIGAYAALYYGCELCPHAVLLGKPLASLGDVAVNERLLRPGGLPQALDVLLYQCGDTTEEAAQQLNQKLWEKFDRADFGKTSFIVSYMLEDDYDATAYRRILSHLRSEGVRIYGKGIHGRHNDENEAILQWFLEQYGRILENDFNRGQK